MNSPDRSPRKAAIAFILLVLFIDILGIGIVIPVLPGLITELVAKDTAGGELVVTSPSDTSMGAATRQLPSEAPQRGAVPVSGASSEMMGLEVEAGKESEAEKAAAISRASWFYGMIGASYALMQFIFSPIIGSISDRFGRRPVLLVSMFGLGIDFLIQGFATNLVWLFVGRILAGIMGASLTTGRAYIADVSTDENRARNFGLVGAMFGLGFSIGPALGGFLANFDLRLPFFVAAGLALLNWCYGFFILPESLPPEKRSQKLSFSGANPFHAIAFLRSVPIVASLAIVFVLTSFAQRGLENVWVLYTDFKFGWDARINGFALGLVGVMAIIVQGGLVRPVVARIGERSAVIMGTVISAVAFLGYGLASSGWMIPLLIIFGSLSGLAGPALQSLVAGAFEDSEQGRVQGALTSLMSLTSIAAPVFFNTLIFSYFTRPDAFLQIPGAPLIVGSLLIAIAAVLVLRVFRKYAVE